MDLAVEGSNPSSHPFFTRGQPDENHAMSNSERIMYVELKSDLDDSGRAWIGRVRLSKTGQTVYYRGLTLARARRKGAAGNHVDIATGDEYWVSGVKKDGTDRHWAGHGPVHVDSDVLDEYLEMVDKSVASRLRKRARVV